MLGSKGVICAGQVMELFELKIELSELAKEQLQLLRSWYNKTEIFMLPHSLTNFEIQRDYQNEQRSNGFYSTTCLPRIKDGPYVINLDEHNSIGTGWIALYVNGNSAAYFDSSELNRFQKKLKNVKTKEML